MQRSHKITAFLVFIIVAFSCKKENNASADCLSNAPILRQITSKQATVKSVDGKFYIIEQGAIDTRLNPCNLPSEFREGNLKVIISGDIKLSLQAGPGPCCTENLLITKIIK